MNKIIRRNKNLSLFAVFPILVVSIFSLFLFIQVANAATYYMTDNFSNLHAAFSAMSSGDTLIIMNGNGFRMGRQESIAIEDINCRYDAADYLKNSAK